MRRARLPHAATIVAQRQRWHRYSAVPGGRGRSADATLNAAGALRPGDAHVLVLDQRDADVEALIAGSRGDVPLVRLRCRCNRCGASRVDMVCTSKDVGATV